jgi:hypothetical protein
MDLHQIDLGLNFLTKFFFCGIVKTNGMPHVQYHGVHDMHS